jgi:two-component system OmpR family response regulator
VPLRALVVDADERLRELLATALRYEGFSARTAASGRDAATLDAAFGPEVVIVDALVDNLDRLELHRRAGDRQRLVAVLLLTHGDGIDDVQRGRSLGADDYLQKPFSSAELVARANGVLRRAGTAGAPPAALAFADLELDDDAGEVRRGGELVPLTPTEYGLLRFLLANAGHVVSKEQILDHAWPYDFAGDANVVETYVSYLRRKLHRLGPPLIHTVRGRGYVLRAAARRPVPVRSL